MGSWNPPPEGPGRIEARDPRSDTKSRRKRRARCWNLSQERERAFRQGKTGRVGGRLPDVRPVHVNSAAKNPTDRGYTPKSNLSRYSGTMHGQPKRSSTALRRLSEAIGSPWVMNTFFGGRLE